MIVDRDIQVLRHLEEYRYATLSQIEKIVFKKNPTGNNNYSYNIARRRLAELKKHGYIKYFRDTATNKFIYMLDDKNEKFKPPSMSRMLILDIYAEMVAQNFEIEIFDIEKFWCGGKYRSDAFAIFTFNGYRYHFFIEVQLSNHNHNLQKYDELYLTNEVQNYYKNELGYKEHFPKILLVTDKHYSKIDVKSTEVKVLDTKLNGFASILL